MSEPADTACGEDVPERVPVQRWTRLPERVAPESWLESVAVDDPDPARIVRGDGVDFTGGVPIG